MSARGCAPGPGEASGRKFEEVVMDADFRDPESANPRRSGPQFRKWELARVASGPSLCEIVHRLRSLDGLM